MLGASNWLQHHVNDVRDVITAEQAENTRVMAVLAVVSKSIFPIL